MSVTCDYCGTSAASEKPPLTWSLTVERGQVRRYCEQCTRDHVRSMEGKLQPEHW